MGLSRCHSLMKCLLILFNIIFLCVGAAACGFAGWALYDGRATETGAARAGLVALGAWGAALALGALAALAGAARPSAELLAAAVALLALSAAAEAAAAWWGAAHLPRLRAALHDRLDHTLRHDYGVLHSRTQVLDAIQQGLECCGVAGARDWQGSAWARALEASGEDGGPAHVLDLSVSAPVVYYLVPPSCCKTTDVLECETARRVAAAAQGGGGAGGAGGAGGLWGAGCGARVQRVLGAWGRGAAGAGAALLGAHVLAVLLALALALRARPHRQYKA